MVTRDASEKKRRKIRREVTKIWREATKDMAGKDFLILKFNFKMSPYVLYPHGSLYVEFVLFLYVN